MKIESSLLEVGRRTDRKANKRMEGVGVCGATRGKTRWKGAFSPSVTGTQRIPALSSAARCLRYGEVPIFGDLRGVCCALLFVIWL